MNITAWLNGDMIEKINPMVYGRIDIAIQAMVDKLEGRAELQHCVVSVRGPRDIRDFCRGYAPELFTLTFKE